MQNGAAGDARSPALHICRYVKGRKNFYTP